MNSKPGSTADKPEPSEAPADPSEAVPKRSAMRLPDGVGPNKPQRPALRKPWENQNGGRPQQDFARRAGKSRKVH